MNKPNSKHFCCYHPFCVQFFVHPAKETVAISVSCFLLCLAPLEYLAYLPKIAFVYAL